MYGHFGLAAQVSAEDRFYERIDFGPRYCESKVPTNIIDKSTVLPRQSGLLYRSIPNIN